MAGEYLTSTQVARLLGISKSGVLRAVDAGQLHAVYRMPGGAHRFMLPDVERYAQWRELRQKVEEQAKAVLRTEALQVAANGGSEMAGWMERLAGVTGEGEADAGTEIGNLLALLADSLQVGATLLARCEDRAWPIAYVHDRAGLGLQAGSLLPWPEVLTRALGAGPSAALLVEDVRTDARLALMAEPAQLGVGTLTAVPVHTTDGQLFGGLCTLHPATRTVPGGEVALLRLAGRMAMQAVEEAGLRERERQAAQRAARLAAIVEQSGDAVFRMSASGRIETWNAGAVRLYGYEEEEVIGQSIRMLAPAERAHEQSIVLERLGHGQDIVDFETVRRHKGGSPIDVSMTISGIWDADGRLLGGSVISRDIGDRMRARRAQEEQAQEDAAVAAVSAALAGSLDLDEVSQAIVDQAARLLPCDLAAVLEYQGETAVVAASSGPLRVPAGDRYTWQPDTKGRWSDMTQARLYVPDMAAESGRQAVDAGASGPALRSVVHVPLAQQGEAAGCLIVASLAPHAYSARHVRLAVRLGEYAARALSNARLYASLRRSEQDFRLLAENSADVIARLSPDLIVRYVSPAVRLLLGYEPAQVVGRQVVDHVHPDDREAYARAVGRVLAEPVTEAITYQHRHADGRYVWVESTGHAVRDPATGAVLEIQAAVRDISVRKQAEEALRQVAEERAERAAVAEALAEAGALLASSLDVEHIHDAILQALPRLVPSTTTHVVVYREGWAVVAGAHGTPRLPVGTRLARLEGAEGMFPQSPEQARLLHETRGAPGWQNIDPWVGEQETRSAILQPIIVRGETYGALGLGSVTPYRFTERHVYIAQAFAERLGQALWNARLYQLEQERARAAERLAALRNDFVTAVNHELRTPLTAALGYAELLAGQWSQLSDAQRQLHVQRIVLAANRQKRLIDDLLRAGTYEEHQLSARQEHVRVLEVVARARALANASYAEQRIDAVGSPDLEAVADPSHLEQVLVNLLDNAAKYSPEGSPIEVRWATEDGMAVIRVRDHGHGIPEEGRGILFTRFGRLPGSGMRPGRVGTGLGLYLGRAYAEAMGGSLDLEVTGASGSIFCLRLPVHCPETAGRECCGEGTARAAPRSPAANRV